MSLFNIQATPPTVDDIQRARSKIYKRGAYAIAAMLLFFIGWAVWVASARSDSAALAFLLVFMVIALAVAAFWVEVYLIDLRDLSDGWCKDLYELCMSTPEGQDYRAAVLEQGRKFTNAEHEAMKIWADGRAHREACHALYNIPA